MINIFDRLKLKENFSSKGIKLKAGTIGTCRSIVNNDGEFKSDNEIVILQYSYDKDNDLVKYIGIPSMYLEHVTTNDLDNVKNYKNLLPKSFHIGRKYMINKQGDQKIGSIYKIRLTSNELHDEFALLLEDGSTDIYTKKYLDDYASLVNDNLYLFEDNDLDNDNLNNNNSDNENLNNNDLNNDLNNDSNNILNNVELDYENLTYKTNQLNNDNAITIKVNEFEFIVNNNTIYSNFKTNELSNYIKAINDFSNFIKGVE